MPRSTRRRPLPPRVAAATPAAAEQPAFFLPEFLESDEARPIRIVAEYLEPLRRFRDEQIQDTVVFFGSARVHSRERAQRDLVRANHRRRRVRRDELLRWQRAVEWSRYYEDARELAHNLTRWSRALAGPCHRFVVCSGGGPGIMEAANRGAYEDWQKAYAAWRAASPEKARAWDDARAKNVPPGLDSGTVMGAPKQSTRPSRVPT